MDRRIGKKCSSRGKTRTRFEYPPEKDETATRSFTRSGFSRPLPVRSPDRRHGAADSAGRSLAESPFTSGRRAPPSSFSSGEFTSYFRSPAAKESCDGNLMSPVSLLSPDSLLNSLLDEDDVFLDGQRSRELSQCELKQNAPRGSARSFATSPRIKWLQWRCGFLALDGEELIAVKANVPSVPILPCLEMNA